MRLPHPFPHAERVPLVTNDHFPSPGILLWPDISSHHEFTGIGGIQLDASLTRLMAVSQSPFMGQSISLLEGLSQLDADAIEAQLPLYLLEGVREEPDLVIAAKQLAMGHDAKIPFNLPQHGASLFLWQRREGELAELARFEHGVGHG